MKFFYWFRIVVKVLIPLMFFVIANITKVANYDWANALAGFMTIAVLFYYILIWQKVGENKEDK
jgi:hypothetical protein